MNNNMILIIAIAIILGVVIPVVCHYIYLAKLWEYRYNITNEQLCGARVIGQNNLLILQIMLPKDKYEEVHKKLNFQVFREQEVFK